MTGRVGGNNERAPNRGLMETTDELPTEVAAPLVLGRYRLGDRLGAGGFGTVYAATDERLQRAVAVKVIPSGPARDPERGRREALAAGRLDHPGVVAVFDAGEDDRARYLVSELVYGRTVDELCAEGLLTDRDVLRIGLALCGALEHAHGRGVVHRDVKPQNVIIPDAPRSAAGVAKLADFGVAHLAGDDPLTRTGDVVGTLAYMAPEQAAGKRIDERADLYSLALVLYEALAGRQPGARRLARGHRAPRRHRAPAAAPQPQGPAGGAVRGDRHRAAPEAGRARDARRARRRAGRVAAGGLRRGRRVRRAAPDRAHARRCRAGPTGPRRPRWPAGSSRSALQWLGEPVCPRSRRPSAVAVLPRVGWLLAAVATVARDRRRTARRGAAGRRRARARPARCCCRRGTTWSLPALAPLLGLAGLAGAYPALAGRARGPLTRAALGALGAWWALLAAPLLGARRSAAPARHGRDGRRRGARRCDAAQRCRRRARRALRRRCHAARRLTSEPLITARFCTRVIWAAAALVLPWLVRGRWLALDVVAACAWAAALGASTAATAEFIGAPEPRGLVLGAVIAGRIAVAVPHLRGGRVVEP